MTAPLLPYFDESHASPELRELLGRLPVKLNLFRMMAHAQTSIKPVMRLGAAILSKQKLDPLARELVVMQAMALQHGEYEWVQHVPIAHEVGITAEQLAAIEAGRTDAPCFDARQQVLLRFTTEAVQRVGVTEEAMQLARQHFDPREIVEILLTVGFYSMMARLTESTRVELDVDGGPEVVAALRERAAAQKSA